MKKTITMFAAFAMIAGLCAGCGKTDKPEPEAAKQTKEVNTKNWAPETAKPPKAHDPHAGHNH